MAEDYYDILGIGRDADSRSIRNAYRREAKKSHPAGPILEILLTPVEAARGVRIPVSVPVTSSCPQCSGGDFWQRMFCFTCAGSGTVRSRSPMVLRIPAGLPSGGEFLIDAGHSPSQRIRVRVLVV